MWKYVVDKHLMGVWVIRPPVLISGTRPPVPGPLKNFKLAQPSPTESPVTMIIVYGFMVYLNHVDLLMPHVHVKTALMFTVHLSCFVNFILCLTDKYMFKVNKLVLGNCGSSIYC